MSLAINRGMLQCEIIWEGLDVLENYLRNELPKAFSRAIDRTLYKVGDITVEKAQQLVPVRTGLLRSTIRKQTYKLGFDTNYAYVGIAAGGIRGCDYAAFVEYGTSRMRPQPYLRPAMRWGMKRLPNIFWNELAREVEMG